RGPALRAGRCAAADPEARALHQHGGSGVVLAAALRRRPRAREGSGACRGRLQPVSADASVASGSIPSFLTLAPARTAKTDPVGSGPRFLTLGPGTTPSVRS